MDKDLDSSSTQAFGVIVRDPDGNFLAVFFKDFHKAFLISFLIGCSFTSTKYNKM